MNLPDIFKSKNAVAIVPVFRSEETRQLVERFENIKNIADPADRLLMLYEIRGEMHAQMTLELDNKNKGFGVGKMLLITCGTVAVISGGAALAIVPLAGAIALIPSAFVGVFLAEKGERRFSRQYNARFKDIDVLESMVEEARTLQDKILKTVDTKLIAKSPRGVDAFTQFPALKDKFMLALTVDRVNAEENDKLAAGLGKAIKEPAVTQRVDL